MNTEQIIRIRPATLEDESFILSLIPRLTEFGPPSWRDIVAMTETHSSSWKHSIIIQ